MQYQDPRRVTMAMITPLKPIRTSKEDPISSRSNLNDVQAIVATRISQKEIVDTIRQTF